MRSDLIQSIRYIHMYLVFCGGERPLSAGALPVSLADATRARLCLAGLQGTHSRCSSSVSWMAEPRCWRENMTMT